MAVERIITPAPYVYGKTDENTVTQAVIEYVNLAGFTCKRVFDDVTRYFVGKDGSTLTLHTRGVKEKALKIEWDRMGRIWVTGGGSSEVVKNLTAVITENGEMVVAA